jgi:bifunctional UDP-N-acetylglucosamine pyrophosphorylase/glucosamine-1-phosphate N-acetyltransferase
MEFWLSVHRPIVKAARAGENSRTMPNKDVVIAILAAGKGTRLKSSLAKVLHPAGGRSLVEQVVVACAPLKAKKVVAHHWPSSRASRGRGRTTRCRNRVAAAAKRNWPRHAHGQARRSATAKFAVVLPGRRAAHPSGNRESLCWPSHRSGNAAATILSAVLADPSGYGRIVRKSETQVGAIVEDSQLTPEQRELNEINSSMYCFTLAKLWPALAKDQALTTNIAKLI